jgi:hypothetical protein
MAKYVRTSKRLQRIRWIENLMTGDRELRQREDMLFCFLPALQESTSLKVLYINFPLIGGPFIQAMEKMLTHTQSLQSLCLSCAGGRLQVSRRLGCGYSLDWTEKEHHSTRAHTVISAPRCQYLLSHFDQSERPSSPSKGMFAWAFGGSDWPRDFVAKRHLQNHGT